MLVFPGDVCIINGLKRVKVMLNDFFLKTEQTVCQ